MGVWVWGWGGVGGDWEGMIERIHEKKERLGFSFFVLMAYQPLLVNQCQGHLCRISVVGLFNL